MKKVLLISSICAALYFISSCNNNQSSPDTHKHDDGSTHADHDTTKPVQQEFNVADKTNDGSGFIVHPLHFVSRSVYSLRFDERQVYAGCCFCNLDMHLHPEGQSVKNYQDKLIDKLGIVEVMRMVAQKRVVNKLSVEDLKEVIQKYQTNHQ